MENHLLKQALNIVLIICNCRIPSAITSLCTTCSFVKRHQMVKFLSGPFGLKLIDASLLIRFTRCAQMIFFITLTLLTSLNPYKQVVKLNWSLCVNVNDHFGIIVITVFLTFRTKTSDFCHNLYIHCHIWCFQMYVEFFSKPYGFLLIPPPLYSLVVTQWLLLFQCQWFYCPMK